MNRFTSQKFGRYKSENERNAMAIVGDSGELILLGGANLGLSTRELRRKAKRQARQGKVAWSRKA